MAEDTKDDKAEAKPASGKPSILGLILPAVFAGAAAFGGAKGAAGGGHHEKVSATAKPPGYTQMLEPFILTLPDATAKPHAMKVTLGIEFDATMKEDVAKTFTPRIRDMVLSRLRSLSFEEASKKETADNVRKDLIAKLKKSGITAEQILITDFVLQ